MTIREKLTRLTKMMSPTKLANASGLPTTTVMNYISGKSVPGAKGILPLAQGLGVDVRWLLDDRADWPPVYTDARDPAGEAA